MIAKILPLPSAVQDESAALAFAQGVAIAKSNAHGFGPYIKVNYGGITREAFDTFAALSGGRRKVLNTESGRAFELLTWTVDGVEFEAIADVAK